MPRNKFDVVVLSQDTYVQKPNLNWYNLQVLLEDELVIAALESLDIRVTKKSWSDKDFDWSQTQTAIFRTTWDYFEQIEAFRMWLESTSAQTQLINDVEIIQWNMDKHYLLDIQSSGVNCVDTYIINKDSVINTQQVLASKGWSKVVIKPTVSAAAKDTYLYDCAQTNEIQATVDRLVKHQDIMLQPFQENIQSIGEISLIVIDGEYTHSVKKRAKDGDFRVQDDHGGTVSPYFASQNEIDFAELAISKCPKKPLYARVDIIQDNQGHLALMELELIEPELFFRFCQPAATKLAQALKRQLQR